MASVRVAITRACEYIDDYLPAVKEAPKPKTLWKRCVAVSMVVHHVRPARIISWLIWHDLISCCAFVPAWACRIWRVAHTALVVIQCII